MRNEKEIDAKLKELYKRRLALRLRKLLARTPENCIHHQTTPAQSAVINYCDICPGICDTVERASVCRMFSPTNTREMIEAQMLEDVRNPRACGQREPKIAMLMWVLQSEGAPYVESEPSEYKPGRICRLCRKLLGWTGIAR